MIYGTLGDDYVDGGDGNDQLSGGNGYDTFDGGAGTNLFAFDRTRDKIVGAGKSIVRQSLDAGSSALVLGSTWISPLTTRVATNAQLVASKFNPLGMNAASIGTTPKLASGASATPYVLKQVAIAPEYLKPAAPAFVVAAPATSFVPTTTSAFVPTIFGINSDIVVRVSDEDDDEGSDDDVMFLDELTSQLYARLKRDDDIAFYD
ncbi:hypothetical protein G5575_13775 [Devosia chinhatensis]|uniref:Calcium-binding protein n=2 Tax=Devosia aurantiaca TaxID=2714858 RepID=A0A6M1SPT6_9HYPH|nr:hypothetical protein [Devosia aurantiaca]